jgi:pyridoxal phosphate-dependent aminotransferase EpsN
MSQASPPTNSRIYLSPPEVTEQDREYLLAALAGGWIAPLGPDVDAFETELGAKVDRSEVVALSSGTAALHLALLLAGVGPGDKVLVSTLTFAATANAVRYVGAEPVFVDSSPKTWNLDPDLLAEVLEDGRRTGHRFAAAIVVDLYGSCADYERIEDLLAQHEVPLIEDAAEALGGRHQGRPAGSFGMFGVLSFNGNKIITTSGGGALLGNDPALAAKARFLATQARDPAPHYEHSELGYNYRLSNLLAALGRSQLSDLERRVEARRAHNAAYRAALAALPGTEFMPEPPGSFSTFWLTTLTLDSAQSGIDRDEVRLHLEELNIEARPVWKPMHLQPLYAGCRVIGGAVSADLFNRGICLPSGSSLDEAGRDRVLAGIFDLVR